jgi:hypothetical protein
MKTALICAALLAALPNAANAEPAPALPESAPAASAAALNGDTPIETVMATPAGKAAIEKLFPDVPGHPAYEQFKGMSLRELAPLAGGLITDDKIAAFEVEMKAAK